MVNNQLIVDLSEEQVKILKHFADTLGLTLEEAGMHMITSELIKWYPVMQNEPEIIYQEKKEATIA